VEDRLWRSGREASKVNSSPGLFTVDVISPSTVWGPVVADRHALAASSRRRSAGLRNGCHHFPSVAGRGSGWIRRERQIGWIGAWPAPAGISCGILQRHPA